MWLFIIHHYPFDSNKNKYGFYRGEDPMKKFCVDLRKHATEIINCEKKEMLLLTKKQEKKYVKQKVCHICKQEFNEMFNEDENYRRVRDHRHYTGKFRGAPHSICNLRYKTPKEILVVFHSGCNYDCNFLIKELAVKFKGLML